MHTPDGSRGVEPDCHGSDHVFAVLLVANEGSEGGDKGDERAEEVGEGAFEDAAAGGGGCEGPEGGPFLAEVGVGS